MNSVYNRAVAADMAGLDLERKCEHSASFLHIGITVRGSGGFERAPTWALGIHHNGSSTSSGLRCSQYSTALRCQRETRSGYCTRK